MLQHGDASNSNTKMQSNTTQKRMPQRGRGRKFFQQLQPTFAIELSRNTTKLEFLDQNDPAKDTIVRKKAREWVNKNRDITNQNRQKQLHMTGGNAVRKVEHVEDQDMQVQRRESNDPVVILSPLQAVRTRQFDPFNVLPDVGRKYDHIIEYFLTSCPEEVPCSDDKYADPSKHSLISFSRENTVLGNMAQTEVTFVLWLYATASIRDGIMGFIDTEEVNWFYSKALKMMQETLKKEAEAAEYSDHLLNALACITATASFSGMFHAAKLHRDAMIQVLTVRGDGDVLKGLQSAGQWTSKALQWCEMIVAAQLVEVPRVPYYHAFPCEPLPDKVAYEAERLTANTLSNLPPVSEPIQYVIRLLHQIGLAYNHQLPGTKIDSYVIQPLYDAQYALLQILQTQKETSNLSDVEVLLAETFQLYFWTGPRLLPPPTRLCDVFISRIMKALLSLLLEKVPGDVEASPVTARGFRPNHVVTTKYVLRTSPHLRTTNNAIAWSLSLGAMVSAALDRPEHQWLKGHWCLHMQAMGLDQDKEEYYRVLELFPTTESFAWIDLRTLFNQLQT